MGTNVTGSNDLLGVNTSGSSDERWNSTTRKAILAALFMAVVVLQAWVHFSATNQGRPYEAWDEMSNYNTAHVMSGPTVERSYRYGSLETFLQWVGIVAYQHFDPIGRAYPHIRYSNNVPQSWDNPYLAFQEKTWPEGIDYCCFRGSDDRQPVFLSRQIHLLVIYSLIIAIGLTMIALFAEGAIFVMAPLMLFTVAPTMYFQIGQSLPNAVNAVLTFGSVLFAMVYCQRQRLGYLLVAVAFVAAGLNFKPDMLVVVGASILALGFTFLRRGFSVALRDAGWAFVVGAVVTLLTRPTMLVAPVMDLRIRYHELMTQAAGSTNPLYDVNKNWAAFTRLLETTFLWEGAGIAMPLLVIVLFLAGVVGLALRYPRGSMPILLVGASVVLVGWPGVMLKLSKPEPYHFFNGLAVVLAVMGMAMLLAYQRNGVYRRIAQAMLGCFSIIWAGHAVASVRGTLEMKKLYGAHGGLDAAHNRNLASLEAIQHVTNGKYPPVILVDQHSYTDLRQFRLRNIDARFLNLRNFRQVLSALDPARSYLVMFSRGNFDRGSNHLHGWQGNLTPELRQSYLSYQKYLLSLPVAKHYPGTPQAILWAGPVAPKNEVFLSVYSSQGSGQPGSSKPASSSAQP